MRTAPAMGIPPPRRGLAAANVSATCNAALPAGCLCVTSSLCHPLIFAPPHLISVPVNPPAPSLKTRPPTRPLPFPRSRRCDTCESYRDCLKDFCKFRKRDNQDNRFTLVPAGQQSGYCYVERAAWACTVDLNASSPTSFTFRTSAWDCDEPGKCPTPPSSVVDEYNNGARVAYGFAIAAAGVLMMCCGLAVCAYTVAGKNAVMGRRGGGGGGDGGGGRAAAYEAKPPEHPDFPGAGDQQPPPKKKWYSRG